MEDIICWQTIMVSHIFLLPPMQGAPKNKISRESAFPWMVWFLSDCAIILSLQFQFFVQFHFLCLHVSDVISHYTQCSPAYTLVYDCIHQCVHHSVHVRTPHCTPAYTKAYTSVYLRTPWCSPAYDNVHVRIPQCTAAYTKAYTTVFTCVHHSDCIHQDIHHSVYVCTPKCMPAYTNAYTTVYACVHQSVHNSVHLGTSMRTPPGLGLFDV